MNCKISGKLKLIFKWIWATYLSFMKSMSNYTKIHLIGVCSFVQNYSVIYILVTNEHETWKSSKYQVISRQEISVRPKPGFGIGNRNQDQVSVSVSGPELFLPKPKLSRWYRYLESWKKNENFTPLSCYKWSLEIIFHCFITDWHNTY